MTPAAPAAPRVVRKLPDPLAQLAVRTRPHALAREALLPVAAPLTELLGTPGLRRGTTVVLQGGELPGATSLLLALLAGPSAAGAWCGVVGASELGLVAAGEFGVAMERLVLVPEPGRRVAAVVGALLEGCDVVCLRSPVPLAAPETRRLAARARERKAVLLVATGGTASLACPGGYSGRGTGREGRAPSRSLAGWSEVPDVALTVRTSHYAGLESGSGRIRAHLVEVGATRRRAVPEEVKQWLWLPGENGGISAADAMAGDDAGLSSGSELRGTGTR